MASDPAPPLESLEPSLLAARRAESRAVAADLESIFGPPPADAESAPRPAGRGGPEHPVIAPRGSRLGVAGALAAAAFLGVAAGAFVMTASGDVRPKPPAERPALRVELAQAPGPPSPGPIDPRPLQTLAPQPAAAPIAVAQPVAQVSAPVRRAARKAPVPCCSYAQMAAADRRLRRAYSGAVRAGAPRLLLVSYRDQWETLRRKGARDPRGLVTGYRRLASDLDRAAARARSSRYGPSRVAARSPWRPRYAPWWS